MDKNSIPSVPLTEESIARAVQRLVGQDFVPERYQSIIWEFHDGVKFALQKAQRPIQPFLEQFGLFLKLIEEQFREPFIFQPYHQKIRQPFDYYRFSLDFLRPLIDLSRSQLFGLSLADQMEEQLKKGENVVFLANHQTEADPQAIAILLERTHPLLAESIIYVAGERVLTDPMAIPFSMGCDLLCIYSKRYIDFPPELKAKKQLQNKHTMERMSRLLSEGGKAIYVAPSGGRDRRNAQGMIEVASFDPPSIEMFYLMARKAKTPTHFYPLTLSTYELLPPPDTVQRELGELRTAKFTPIHLIFSPELDMLHFPGSEEKDKETRRKNRADAIWKIVSSEHQRLLQL